MRLATFGTSRKLSEAIDRASMPIVSGYWHRCSIHIYHSMECIENKISLIYCDILEGKVHSLYKWKNGIFNCYIVDAITEEGTAFAKGLLGWGSFCFTYVLLKRHFTTTT